MTDSNVQIVRGIYESFGSGDTPAVLEQMDQSIEWNEAENFVYADLNPYIGPQAVLKGLFTRLGPSGKDSHTRPRSGSMREIASWYSVPTPGGTRRRAERFAHNSRTCGE